MSGLFAIPGPRVYSIPPSAAFLDRLAAAVWDEAGRDPMRLTEFTVLLPTRRSARKFADSIRKAAGKAALTPEIRTIGDIDADAPPFEPGSTAADFRPACPAGRRRFELAHLIARMDKKLGNPTDPAATVAAAGELEIILDELAIAEIEDLSPLQSTLPRLPEHLKNAAYFLEIVSKYWPERLHQMKMMDGQDREIAIRHALANEWTAKPPGHPVIAAGSTGSIPATAALLGVIAGLPQGCVVLPGLDADLDDKAWNKIDPQHPQSGLKSLLDRIGMTREEVKAFPGVREDAPARRRRRFVNEALRPAEETADWLSRLERLSELENLDTARLTADALSGVSLIEAETPEGEAASIALALREFLEAEDSTHAILVTPDLSIAARVSARLKRWGVEIDSSAGCPLRETASGAFLNLVLALAEDPHDPVALAAVWKHPLCALGMPRPRLRELAARVEKRALRGVRPSDRDILKTRLTSKEGALEERTWALIEATDAALAPLRDETLQSAANFARALGQSVEAFAQTGEAESGKRGWAGPAGDKAAALIRDLMNESAALPAMDLSAFARIVSLMSEERTVREPPPDHPRLQIMGPLEARLQQADMVILAGLNEGTWPTLKRAEPFFSQAMRKDLGMDPVERRIGLSAHDFAQLLGAPRVILTRAERVEGAPSVASRWLWRLKTLARGALGEEAAHQALAPDSPYTDWARRIDHPAMDELAQIPAPRPCPPVEARPRRISVTGVKTWVRDPYSIYARDVLRLKSLDPLDNSPGGMERGNAIHDALEDFLNAHMDDLPADAADRLTALGEAKLHEAGLSDAQIVAEIPRVRRAAEWFVARERERRGVGYAPLLIEAKGCIEIDAPAGPFTLTARADRIDAGPLGPAVIDYKTGAAPTAKVARLGFDPQLALEAAILAEGGFPGDKSAARQAPQSLLYIRIRGGRSVGEMRELIDADHDGESLMRAAREGIGELISRFDAADQPYLSQPRAQYVNEYGDYDDLARRSEWASQAEGSGE